MNPNFVMPSYRFLFDIMAYPEFYRLSSNVFLFEQQLPIVIFKKIYKLYN